MPFSDAAKSVLASKTFYSGVLAIVTGATTIIAGREIDIPAATGLSADTITTLGVTLGPLLYGLGTTAIASGVGAIYGRIKAHRPVTMPGSGPPAVTPMQDARADLARMEGDPAKLAALRERVGPGPDISPFAATVQGARGGYSRVVVGPGGLGLGVALIVAVAGCAGQRAAPDAAAVAAACGEFDDALDQVTAAVVAGKITGSELATAGALKSEGTTTCRNPAAATSADVATVGADAAKLRALAAPK